jgi:predicted nucleic acid-binding protein
MKKVFADSFFFLAMMNVRDSCHREAVALSETLAGPIITTQWVLVEVGDAFSKLKDRDRFVDLLELIEADDRIHVVAASNSSFQRGTELFTRRKDKSWSLTDCISFTVMEQRNIKEALTGDHHFEQAGYTMLLSQSQRK